MALRMAVWWGHGRVDQGVPMTVGGGPWHRDRTRIGKRRCGTRPFLVLALQIVMSSLNHFAALPP